MLDPTVATSGLEISPGGFAAHWVWEEGRTGNVNPRGQREAAPASPQLGASMPKGVTHGVQGLSVQPDRARPAPIWEWGFNRQHLAPGGKA